MSPSAVLPTCLFGYFRVFREPHRMVVPGNVRFQVADGMLTDWCSPDFDCIDHSVAKSMGKRCVRPSPSGVGYFPSNSGCIRAYRARNASQLRHKSLKAVSLILARALQRHETGESPALLIRRGSAGLLISFSSSSGCQLIWRSNLALVRGSSSAD